MGAVPALCSTIVPSTPYPETVRDTRAAGSTERQGTIEASVCRESVQGG